ncbi:MAG: type II secretion system F family protein [Planctomycetes bacterium]|jgi:type II secretory pathway component PulF|nr:type II secretion system F family protein [Planctomycetota bacterium]
MKLAYKAYDGLGKAVTGIIEAGDTVGASELLHRKGLYVAAIEASIPAQEKTRFIRRHSSGGQRLKDVAWFSRQLFVLVSSGTQLADALHALERQARPGPWRQVITSLRTRVEGGAALAVAMETHNAYFDPIYRNLIAAGESSGRLVEMFDQLAGLKQKQLRVRNSVVGALVYPCLLVTVGLTMFVMLLLFVIPRFAGLFQTMAVPLPASTAVLLHASDAFRAYWWLTMLLAAGAVGGAVVGLRTPRGRQMRDRLVLRLPYVGPIVKSLSTARIVSLLGVLMQARIPVLEALRHVRHSTGNGRYQELIARAEEAVTKGEAMSAAFDDTGLVSPSVYEAIRSGEESGELDRLLITISTFLDEENEVIVRSLTSIIEPLILIVMGLLVGLIAICMFMPLFDLASITQQGG